jgi:hypothetical protein
MKYILLATFIAFCGYVVASRDAPPSALEPRKGEATPPPSLSDGEDVSFPGSPVPWYALSGGAVGV